MSVKALAKERGYTIGPVYHGSENPMQGNTFSREFLGKASGNLGFLGKGFYFTPDIRIAKAYGKYIGKFYLRANMLKIHRPLSAKTAKILEDATNGGDFSAGMSPEDVYNSLSYAFGESSFYAEEFSDSLDYMFGITGVWLKHSGKSPHNEMVVFSPDQIKSANEETYDNAGKKIPLSKRFDRFKDDVRF